MFIFSLRLWNFFQKLVMLERFYTIIKTAWTKISLESQIVMRLSCAINENPLLDLLRMYYEMCLQHMAIGK